MGRIAQRVGVEPGPLIPNNVAGFSDESIRVTDTERIPVRFLAAALFRQFIIMVRVIVPQFRLELQIPMMNGVQHFVQSHAHADQFVRIAQLDQREVMLQMRDEQRNQSRVIVERKPETPSCSKSRTGATAAGPPAPSPALL